MLHDTGGKSNADIIMTRKIKSWSYHFRDAILGKHDHVLTSWIVPVIQNVVASFLCIVISNSISLIQ